MYKFMQNCKYNECIILIFLFANFLQIYNRSSITKKINKIQFFCINIQLLYLFCNILMLICNFVCGIITTAERKENHETRYTSLF